MARITPRNKFFLFRIVDPDSKLERDEPSVLTRLLFLSALIFLIVDLLVLLFFVKTKARIDDMIRDEFVQAIIQVIDEADRTQGEYVKKTMEYINQRGLDVKTFVSELSYNGDKLGSTTIPSLAIDDLAKLRSVLLRIEGQATPSKLDVNEASSLFNSIEKELKAKMLKLAPVDGFVDNFAKLDGQIGTLVSEIQTTLKTYLDNVLALAKRQNKNQLVLYKSIRELLTEFDQIYAYIYKNDAYTTLNNMYRSKFLEFENDFVPFSQVVYGHYNAGKLTETVGIELTLPRVYYCTLQAYVSGLGNFGVKFEYVDHGMDGKEMVLAATEEIRGAFKDPISVSEMQVFELPKGRHNLYLRVLSQGGSSQLRMKDFAHECVSYRNFHEESH